MGEFPAGRLVKVEFEVCLPAAANANQIEDWINFALGNGSLPADNPLSDFEVEAFGHQVMLTDTDMVGRREEFDHTVSDDGRRRSCRVRYVRERSPLELPKEVGDG